MIDKLLLDSWMGDAQGKDYIDWAVDLLMAGRDTPSLRILAGLNASHERGDIEEYFLRTCRELGLEPLQVSANPRDAVPLVRRLYRSGTLSPEDTLYYMCRLYELSEHSDPLLDLWFTLREALADLEAERGNRLTPVWPAEYFRLPEETEPLEETIDREWELFDRAVGLDLPEGFQHFVRCEGCRHIGPHAPLSRAKKLHNWTLGYALGSLQPNWECAKCGDSRLIHMVCAEVREDYFSRLRGGGESLPSLTRTE
jgi:hypothetical protein